MTSTLASPTVTAILGKRRARRNTDSFVLHLASGSELSYAPSDSEFEPPSGPRNTPSGPPILANGKLIPYTKKRYQCTHSGCDKSYSKPSRLAEHERSHTGFRPFLCDICNKSYLRETHLQAHARSHLPDSARPLVCPDVNCGKRFWTSQHLRAHVDWHSGAKPFSCSETNCNEKFAKNYQLRTHISSAHAEPGTKPFQCDQEGCTKSFATNQHLRAHLRIHDQKRYTCIHSTCLVGRSNAPTYYPTWTALQCHIRTVHPPACSEPSCNGRTFSSQKGLRAHQKLHEQRNLELEIETALAGSDRDDANDNGPPWKRRRGGEIGRDWKCSVAGCDKDFKSKKGLLTHTNVTHLGRRDHVCPHETCQRAYGYKHLLRRHLAKVHAPSTSSLDSAEPSSDEDGTNNIVDSEGLVLSGNAKSSGLDIDTITGSAYAKRAHVDVMNAKALHCPYPHLGNIIFTVSADLTTNTRGREKMKSRLATEMSCDYVFSRAYDFRRHLKAAHGVDGDKESVDEWVKSKKHHQAHS